MAHIPGFQLAAKQGVERDETVIIAFEGEKLVNQASLGIAQLMRQLEKRFQHALGGLINAPYTTIAWSAPNTTPSSPHVYD
jgi:hypothetical protein